MMYSNLSTILFTVVCFLTSYSFALQNTLTCVYQSWAANRMKLGSLNGDEIPAELCTHVVYVYASIYEHKIFTQLPMLDYATDGGSGNIAKMVSLKKKNPSLKALIGVGGWNAGGWIFSDMAQSEEGRQTFIQSVIDFCTENQLDGIFIDWLFPGVPVRAGTPEDLANYASLLTEMRAAFDESAKKDMFIGVTVASAPGYVQNYDAVTINSTADLVYVISYDLAGWWNGSILHPSPLFNGEDDSVDTSIRQWLKAGIRADKLVVGIPTFARTYQVPNNTDPSKAYDAVFSGDGLRGPISQAPGFLLFPETCAALQYAEYTIVRDDVMKVPYAYSANQVIMYEDQISVQEKAKYVQDNKLAGAYVFSIDQDDVKGFCGPSFALTRAVASILIPGIKTITVNIPKGSDQRCISATKDCDLQVPCFRYPETALSNVSTPCAKDIPCMEVVGILECPIPPSVLAAKRKLFNGKEQVFVSGANGAMQPVKCSSTVNSKSKTSKQDSAENYVCTQVGLSGPSVQEYTCPPNTVFSAYYLKCLVPK